MDEKNQEALALAYRRTKAKINKIKELGIKQDMTEKQVDALITKMAKAKAETPESIQEGKPWTDHVKGQRWYVEDLIEFDKLDVKEKLDYEYSNSFADTASEDEMLEELEKLSA